MRYVNLNILIILLGIIGGISIASILLPPFYVTFIIALSLADNYTFYKDTNLINKAIDHYRAITREDIREAARKYLDKKQRLDLNYLPSVQ